MAKYAFNNINVILLYVSTTKEFIDKWNLLPDRIESLHIFLHGGPGVLYFQDGELSTKDLYSLEKKEINGKAYLFSCNGGTGVGATSIASVLSIKLYGSKVRALVNGKVSFRNWNQLISRKPLTKEANAYWADFSWTRSGLGSLRISKLGHRWEL